MHENVQPEIDWNACRTFLLGRVRRYLGGFGRDPEVVEEVAQDAWTGTYESVERQRPDNLEALMERVARNHAVSYMRRRGRWDPRMVSIDDGEMDLSDSRPRAGDDPLGDPVERLTQALAAWFEQHKPKCRTLQKELGRGRTLKVVAENWGVTHTKIRQDWSRCMKAARSAFATSPTLSVLVEMWQEEGV